MSQREIDVELLDELWRLGDAASAHCAAMMQDRTDLSLAHFFVLRVLMRAGRSFGTTDIANALGCAKSNASKLVSYLEGRRCMTKRRHADDARALVVEMTVRGVDHYVTCAEQLADDAARIFAPLSDEEKEVLGALLKKITFPSRPVGA